MDTGVIKTLKDNDTGENVFPRTLLKAITGTGTKGQMVGFTEDNVLGAMGINADTLQGHDATYFTDLINEKENKITYVQINLPGTGWNDSTQTIAVTGVLEDSTKQLVIPVPVAADAEKYYHAGIVAINSSANRLTFRTVNKITDNLSVYVILIPIG